MTRLLCGMILSAAVVGCTGFQPVGPLAKPGHAPGKSVGKTDKPKDTDLPPEPITVPAVKPTPPVNWVDPTDVSIDPHGSAEKLMREYEADQKTILSAPKTAEISRYKGGVKQN